MKSQSPSLVRGASDTSALPAPEVPVLMREFPMREDLAPLREVQCRLLLPLLLQQVLSLLQEAFLEALGGQLRCSRPGFAGCQPGRRCCTRRSSLGGVAASSACLRLGVRLAWTCVQFVHIAGQHGAKAAGKRNPLVTYGLGCHIHVLRKRSTRLLAVQQQF